MVLARERSSSAWILHTNSAAAAATAAAVAASTAVSATAAAVVRLAINEDNASARGLPAIARANMAAAAINVNIRFQHS